MEKKLAILEIIPIFEKRKNMIKTIFVVEDDDWYGEYLKYHLELNLNYKVYWFKKASECIKNIHLNPDVITMDINMPGMTGEELFKKIHKIAPEIPTLIISGQGEIQKALDLIRAGANEYIYKDKNTIDFLNISLAKINETLKLKSEVITLRSKLEKKYKASNIIIGRSQSLDPIFSLIEKASSSNINVAITGETGTGKELVAKAIHFNSESKTKPFITVNMSAIPSELIESELFGHEKGAFTGAHHTKKGKFEEANHGTILLDEIADIDLHFQSKLLRAIQEKEITRIGSSKIIKLDLRIITATHKNLAQEVRNGNFREDLYYRLQGLPIELPPLRNRGNDILVLSKHFISEYCKENKIKKITLTQEAKSKLLKHVYPGNVRELKALIDLACLLSINNTITEEQIQFNSIEKSPLITQEEKTMKEYEKDIIISTLSLNNNNVIKTAKKLDISKSKIYNLLKEIKNND